MHILIAGASGFIGSRLVEQLDSSHQLTLISRHPQRIKQRFSEHTVIDWDQLNSRAQELFPQFDAIINLCGENIGAQRWTTKRKQILTDSRIKPTHTLMQLCQQTNTQPITIHANGIGIYGASEHDQSQPFTEEQTLNPDSNDFLTTLARSWEDTAYRMATAEQRVITLRLAVVCDTSGGIIKKLSLPFKLGLGGKIGHGKQPFPWISLTDAVRAIEYILENDQIRGPVNLIAPNTITQSTMAKILGKTLHRPTVLPMPACMVRLLFGEMGEHLLLSGQIAWPEKLINNGFTFQHETLNSALS
jgi:uncharacterized protein